jgi:quinol monooxygenase YgiN
MLQWLATIQEGVCKMVHVIASIQVKPEFVGAFLEIFKANVPHVRAEHGCLDYTPTIDIDAELAPQQLDRTIVTIIEKWESLDALRAHLKAPHMLTYKEAVANMVESVSLKVLQPA